MSVELLSPLKTKIEQIRRYLEIGFRLYPR